MSLERAEAGLDPVHDGRMKTIMKLEDLATIEQLTDFLSGTQAVAFSIISNKDECYRWIQGGLVTTTIWHCPGRIKASCVAT